MKLNIFASGLAIVLGMAGVGTIGFPEAAIAQTQTSEIDRTIEEGFRLFQESSAESLRKAISYFEKALELARSAKAQDKQALSLLFLGKLHDLLGEKQKAIEYFNQALPILRAVGDRSSEAATLNNIGLVYSSLGEKQKALEYYNQALPIFRAVGDRSGEATTLNNIGSVYNSLGEKQKALGYYNQILPIFRTVGNRSGEATTLANIGLVYDSLGEKQKALEYYNQALPISRAVGDRLGEATTLNNIGAVYNSLGDKQKALEYYNQALFIFRAVGNRSIEAGILNNIGSVYDSLGERQKALEYYNQALPISRAVGNRSIEAGILNNIGSVYNSLGEKQKALEYYNQALPILRAVGDRSIEATTINNIGNVYNSLGEKQKALEYYNQALPISRAVGDRSIEATTLSSIGNVYDSLGEKQKALEYYNQALPISRAVGNRSGEATTLNNIGAVYDSLGEKQKALEYYNQALPILRAVGDRAGEATTLIGLGVVYSSLGEKQKAIEYYNQVLPISRAVGDRSGEATTLNNLGSVYDLLGEKQKAIEYYNQALPISRAVGNRSGEATTLNNLGDVYYSLGEKQKAIEYFNQALPIMRAVGNRAGEATTLSNLGFVLNSQKQPELAIAVYKQSVNISESLRQEIRKLPRETQEIYTSSVARTYRELANLLLTQGRTREAQAILELLKVQELQSYGKDQETKSAPIQFPIHPLEAQSLETIEKTIASKQPLTLESLTTIGQPLVQNRDRITQEMNNSKITIGNPQALLNANPNAILIQNLVFADKLWVLWTNSNGNTEAIVVPNVNQEQLETTIGQFRKQIGNPYSNLNDLKTTSTQLYNWLIPPQLQTELAQTPKQQLIFSLDHVTRYIPVAALYDGKQYLTQRYSLSNIITTDTNMSDRLTTDGRSPTILALGTSKSYSGFSALPNVEAELKAIVKNGDKGIYPGKIQLNEAFTAQSLTRNLDSYRILHIATHGSFNPKDITASFLLLGNGDRLPITDIATLNSLSTTHLVVLSACETGISGAGQDGTEISGISGYFLRRGAKSVLASLWSVNDASTALIMQQFYLTLSQTKLTKAQALQKIQQDFISGKLTTKQADAIDRAGGRRYIEGQPPIDSFAHPYFWAPFILTGNNQ